MICDHLRALITKCELLDLLSLFFELGKALPASQGFEEFHEMHMQSA